METHKVICAKAVTCFAFLIVSSGIYGQYKNNITQDSIQRANISSPLGIGESITESGMNKDQITNPLDAISGRVPGLTIQRGVNSSAALEAVRVRGTTSLIGDNDPLIIIDGVFGDLNMLTSIYPADIESFTILKDATETAQYGSRGAAGVIEITTKRGAKGKTNVSYHSNFGISAAYKRVDMLSGNGYRNVAKQSGIDILDYGNSTDFQKEIEQTGIRQNHNVAFYGGSETSNYRVSLGYIQREGVIRHENRKNFTSNMKMNHRMFDDLLLCELGMFGSLQNNRNLFDYQKTFYSAVTFNPTFPNHKNKGDNSWDQITTASQITNPLAWMDVKDKDNSAHISTYARMTYQILPELKFALFGTYTYNTTEHSQYLPTSVWAQGQAYKGTDRTESLLGSATLNYVNTWNIHGLDILGLAEVQQDTYRGHSVTVTGFSSDALGDDNLQSGSTRPWEGNGSYYERPRTVSFMGRANYTLLDRYFLTVNARTDASSKFGDGHKWGFFPAISGAWLISEETFMKQFSVINNLKFRIGYGLSGSQGGIGSYNTLPLLQPNGVAPIGNSNLVTYAKLRNANPDLKWEVKKTFNTGFDIGLLDNRVLFSLNYYHSKTTDMLYLYDVSVPPFAYNKLLANLGSMRNTGFELALGVTPVETKDIDLNINVNLTFQKNKLLSLSGEYKGEQLYAPEYVGISELDGAGFHGGYNRIVYQIVGQPLGVFYLPHCTRLVSDGQGGYVYEIADLNGGGVSLEDGEDRYVAGQAIPKALLGSNISFRYKQFDCSVQMNGAFGHKIYNGTALSYMNMNSFPDYNVMKDAPKQNIKDQTATDYWLERGDYVNIDYITVGWNVPISEKNRYINDLRLSFTVNNLATITGYSGLTPMINSSTVNGTLGVDDKRTYPLARTYTIGLNVNF